MSRFTRIIRIVLLAAASAALFFVLGSGDSGQEDTCSLDRDAALSLFKSAERFEKISSECFYDAFGKDSEYLGRVLFIQPDDKSIGGFGGNLRVAVGISPEGKIIGTELGQNNETPGFVETVRNAGFFGKWNGMTPDEALKSNVDTVSGATMSSTAIKYTVAQNLSKYAGTDIKTAEAKSTDFVTLILSMLTLLCSLVFFFFPKRTAKFRIFHLVLTAAVLGFIGGNALSFELFRTVFTSHRIALIPALILGAAIIIPLFTGKNIYCSFICPFGAMQELAGRIPLPKKDLPASFAKGVTIFKLILMLAFAAAMAFGIFEDLTIFEPFSAFKFKAACLSALVIAAVMLIASLFINRPWCRIFCPTGTVISLLKKKNGEEIF